MENATERCSWLIHADGFRWTGLNAGFALCTFLYVHYCNLFVVQGNGLFWAFLDTRSAAHALFSVNYCWHYELLQYCRSGKLTQSAGTIYTFRFSELCKIIVPLPVLEFLPLGAVPAAHGLEVSRYPAYVLHVSRIACRALVL